MSYATFLASDAPIPHMENPHQQFLSINKAIDKGIAIPKPMLDSSTIDRDKPSVLLWIDNEDNLGEITITSTERPYYFTDDYGNPPDTDLPCYAELGWTYSNEWASKLIGFIKNHLENATVVEIWHYWIGDGRDLSKGMKKHSVHMDKLTAEDLENLFANDSVEHDCIVVWRE